MKRAVKKKLALLMAVTMLESSLPVNSLFAGEINGDSNEPATGSTDVTLKKDSTKGSSTDVTLNKNTSKTDTTEVTLNKNTTKTNTTEVTLNKNTTKTNTTEVTLTKNTKKTATTEVTLVKHTHAKHAVKQNAADPTWTEAGHKAYYKCECSDEETKYFEVADGDTADAPKLGAEIINLAEWIAGAGKTVDSFTKQLEDYKTEVSGTVSVIETANADEQELVAAALEEIAEYAHKSDAAVENTLAQDKAAVDAILTKLKSDIAADKFSKLKSEAIAAVNAEKGTDTTENVASAAGTAIDSINSATTAEAVTSAKEAGIAAIRAAKALNADKALFEAKKTEGKTAASGKVTEADSETVRSLAANAVTAIEALEYNTALTAEGKTTLELNKKRVDDILSALDADIAAQKVAEALAAAKEAAIAAINAEKGTDTSANVVSATEAAITAINGSATVAAVDAAKTEGIEAIRAAKAANALAADKAAFEVKKTEGRTAASGKVTETDSEAVRSLAANAVTAIGTLEYNTALTAEGKTTLELNKKRVDDILSALDTDIANQKAIEAAATLENAKKIAIAAITAEVAEDTAVNVVSAATEAMTAINAAEITDAVTAAKDAGITAIRNAKAANALAAAKEEALEAITAEAGEDTTANVVSAATAAKNAINAAETPASVITAKDAGITAIRNAKAANALAAAKTEAIAAITAEVGGDTSANVVSAATEAMTMINAAETIGSVTAAKDAGITAIRNAKAANTNAADKAAFEAKKTEGQTEASGKVTETDSEAVRNLAANAVTAIKALEYNTGLTSEGKTTLELRKH